MTPDLSPEAWAQTRHDYEHTERPIDAICTEQGISSGTLRDRVRRWGWSRRRTPIPRQGPPPVTAHFLPIAASPASAPDHVAAWPSAPGPVPFSAMTQDVADDGLARFDAMPLAGSPDAAQAAGLSLREAPLRRAPQDELGTLDETAILRRLQGAVARLLPAVEGTVARFASGGMRPREMESGVRALASLTRTLRELNALLSTWQAQAIEDDDDEIPKDIDEFRRELARRITAVVESRKAERKAHEEGLEGSPEESS